MDAEEKQQGEIWWPSPEALDDLSVEDIDGGFSLSAPDGTECAAWLNHYNSTDELRERFNTAFMAVLMDYIKKLEENGRKVEEPVGDQAAGAQA